ncbi:hypothetical protein C8Q75DRAFT_775098 [Abortiporus biennis]|nr:hypothetical protein C8Q75DRAFT_775098 [Abortiporus biennis]
MIILESVPEHLPQDCIHRVSAIVTPGTTAKTILDVIINKKRDQYIFAPIGEGCRFWHSTFANDLSDAGVIMQSAAEEAKAALAMYWPYPAGTPPQPRLIAEGRFYDDTF